AEAQEKPLAPLDVLRRRFDLTSFETDSLVLCAAAELDPQLPALLERVPQTGGLRHPTFQLLFNLLPSADWSAFLPQATLRHWRLVEFIRADSVTTSPLRICEPVLHFLMGQKASDERLRELLRPVILPPVLPASYRRHAENLLQTWQNEDAKR